MTKMENAAQFGARIDANLKRAYDEVLEAEVPDRFLHLLEQLRESEIEADARYAANEN